MTGAAFARWSRAGDKLYYMDLGGRVMREVDVSTSQGLTLGKPRELFTITEVGDGLTWDVAPDGRFVFVRDAAGSPRETPALTVVQNWFAEFRRRQPGG